MTTKNEQDRNASSAHDVRNATAVSGAVVGATAGIIGGIAGIGAAGLLGAVFGAIGGLALERDMRRAASDDRERNRPPPATEAERIAAETAAGIEPLCPDCLAVREGSAGSVAWCARHTSHRPHGHLHYAYPPTFAMGSLLIRPAA